MLSPKRLAFCLVVFLGLVLAPSVSFSEELDLSKTKASELFQDRQYAEALVEFKLLEEDYPEDVSIERAIGACLFKLGRDPEAVEVFEKVIEKDPEDLETRQLLVKIYVRQVDLDKAEVQLLSLQEHDTEGRYRDFIETELGIVRRSKEAWQEVKSIPGKEIVSDDFLKSQAAEFLKQGRYEESLREMEALESQYPEDVLVKRYKGLVLDRLGRYDEAMKSFQAGMSLTPNNTALRYFMAQTLFHQKNYDQTKAELEYVIKTDSTGIYAAKAKADLEAVEKLLKFVTPKKWSGRFSTGAEYNTNASSESRFTPSIAEEHAFKFANALSFEYEVFNHGSLNGKIFYSHSNAFFSDTLDNLNAMAHTLGVQLTRVGKFNKRPFITQLIPSGTYTVVDHKYYSSNFSPVLAFIYSLADWHRVILSDRISFSNYKNEGTVGRASSRSGLENLLELINNFYMDKEKNTYFQLGLELETDDPEGSNNVKDAWGIRGAFYFPLMVNAKGNIRFGFKRSDYPETTLSIPRLDEQYTLGLGVSLPLDKVWSLNTNYSYTNNNSQDNTFTYINHAGGASFSAQY